MIKIHSFHANEASYEWLMGGPSATWFLERAKSQAITLWGGNRPTLVCPFPGKDVEFRPGRITAVLPKWSFMAWLHGPAFEPKDHHGMPNDGSHLVVLWWGEDFSAELPPLSEATWREHAKDYGE